MASLPAGRSNRLPLGAGDAAPHSRQLLDARHRHRHREPESRAALSPYSARLAMTSPAHPVHGGLGWEELGPAIWERPLATAVSQSVNATASASRWNPRAVPRTSSSVQGAFEAEDIRVGGHLLDELPALGAHGVELQRALGLPRTFDRGLAGVLEPPGRPACAVARPTKSPPSNSPIARPTKPTVIWERFMALSYQDLRFLPHAKADRRIPRKRAGSVPKCSGWAEMRSERGGWRRR